MSVSNLKIAFIGGGNMGEAMLAALLNKGLAKPETLWVSDISETRRQHLKQRYGVAVMNDNPGVAKQGEIVVLTIKPQNLPAVMPELNGKLESEQLVLSIIAGARLNTLQKGINHQCIVRVMPNTPAQIGEGMSVWTATPETTEQQKKWTGAILGAMGKEIYVEGENYIDMATAISGSGPAYLFLFIESLIEAAVHIGFSQNVAQELVLQTVLGSSHFLQKSGRAPAELRRMVTSPGGTTAEALKVFEEGKFNELVKQAITAAYHKARKLGS
jgi:pyrroline-5-carboxylate reductase